MVRGFHGDLHVVADDAGTTPARRHRTAVGIDQRDLLIKRGKHLLFVNRKLAHFLLQLRQFLGLVTFAASASVGSCRSAVSSWLRATLSKPYSIASAAVPLPNGEVRFPPHTVSPVTRVHSAIGSHPRIISADQSPCGPFQRGASLSRPTHVKNVRSRQAPAFCSQERQ
jgi:hypothetical protein